MGFLRKRIVPKKSVFTRLFSVFDFGIPWGRCPAPKPGALPTALHPDILFCFFIFAVVRCASCCGAQNLLLAFAPQILTAATPFCSLLPPPAALARLLLRCPKFVARLRSPNFDRCHSFLLASSAPGGARKRPQLLTPRCVRWSTELFGGLLPLCSVCPIIIPNIPRKVKGGKWKNRWLGLFFMSFSSLFSLLAPLFSLPAITDFVASLDKSQIKVYNISCCNMLTDRKLSLKEINSL